MTWRPALAATAALTSTLLGGMVASLPAASQAQSPAAEAGLPGGLSPADWREVDPASTVVFDTTKGRVIVELAPWMAPGHAQRITELTREGFYNGLAFHRVIEGFMAQGGDPLGDGSGGSTKPDIEPEFTFRRGASPVFTPMPGASGGQQQGFLQGMPVTTAPDANRIIFADGRLPAYGNHCPGVTSMARAEAVNSANSQFFLMRDTNLRLDQRYTVWGRIVVGLDVVRALKVGEPVVDPDRMIRVRMLADMQPFERPRVLVQRTEGPAFRARLAALRPAPGSTAVTNCDIQPEAQVIAPQ